MLLRIEMLCYDDRCSQSSKVTHTTPPQVGRHCGSVTRHFERAGDTVNLAARMESNSEAGKINISGSTYELIEDKFTCRHRSKIEAKNKGMIEMYFVEN